jgi:DNA invertase Pin-like site-specific DNA recombinase
MDRLARNLDDLRRLVRELTGSGVNVRFLKENLTFTGEDRPMATLLLSVMGGFAECERALIRERQREGIALAKTKGGLPRTQAGTHGAASRGAPTSGRRWRIEIKTGQGVPHLTGDRVRLSSSGRGQRLGSSQPPQIR